MSYEVECGECGEQILIEDLGVEVACPHCETVLVLNEEDIVEKETTAEDSSTAADEEQQTFDYSFSDNALSEQEENGGNGDSGVASAILTEEEAPKEETSSTETATPSDAPNFDFLNQSSATPATEEPPNFSITDSPAHDEQSETAPTASIESSEPAAESTAQPAEAATDAAVENSQDLEERPSIESSETDQPTAQPVTDTSGYPRRNRGPSPKAFQYLVSYSILITLAFLYLFFSFFQAKPHQLESLPDIAPPEEGEFRLIRENASLAPGHTLEIGQTQRFGNIEITPIAVERSSLEFEHFQGNLGESIPPTNPVLKLKLNIKNVSDDQVFPPLDLNLLTIREHDKSDYSRVYANNWVCNASDLDNRENRILMYNHPPTSEYDIKGLETRALNPGEEMETFLPTQEEDLKTLRGDLVWRFQIRKGFHPVSMNGVTTLVEVKFSLDDALKGSS